MRTSCIRDRYLLEREIGRGATGSVWVAQDTQLRRRVAVKMLHTEYLERTEFYARFEREARLVAQLKSPHVVQVYDAGIDGNRPFIVMELLTGESLDIRLHRLASRPLPLSVAVGMVSDIAKGLSKSHHARIIHRDLKPANIFLCHEGGSEVAKLVDFGVALLPSQLDAEEPSVTKLNGMAGTPMYMSPEQLDGLEPDERSDVWSLAVVAYQMLTGRCPFLGNTLGELRNQMNSSAFPAPSSLFPDLGPTLDAFFERALSKEPESRFRSAVEFATELFRVAEGKTDPVIRLLFLDDEPDARKLLNGFFKRQGAYELYFGAEGEEGLEILRRQPNIDAVFTDLNMPGMDGITFLSRVAEVNPLVPVVVISAYSDLPNVRAAMSYGAFDFICKPFQFPDLERTVHKCAAQINTLRRALHSREENGILRSLLGTGLADRLISSIRATEALEHETFEATVVFAGVSGFREIVRLSGPEQGLAYLNEHFELVIPELLAHQGRIVRFADGAVFALFEGEHHLPRALDSCFAIRERLRAQSYSSPLENGLGYGVSIGVDSGEVLVGGVGSTSSGRLEHVVLGDAVSAASELQQLAEMNEVLVSLRVESRMQAEYVFEPSRQLQSLALDTRPSSAVARRQLSDPSGTEHLSNGGSTVSTMSTSGAVATEQLMDGRFVLGSGATTRPDVLPRR